MKITVLGNNLASRHFIHCVSSCHPAFEICLWTFDSSDDFEFDTVQPIFRYYGVKNLPNALLGVDIVVNLHECTDFSLTPDIKKLQYHNVEIVKLIILHIDSPLIHLSTPFLQCSNRWPNVYEPERDPLAFNAQWPFQEYCSSKYEAEQLIKNTNIDSYILRCVPAYGEGDRCSILTDLIYFSNDRSIVRLGDNDGHMQMAYAGNISSALWNATCRLLSQSSSSDLNDSFDDKLNDSISSTENSLLYEYEVKERTRKPFLSVIKEESEDLEGYRARHNTVRTSFDESSELNTFKKSEEIEDEEVFNLDEKNGASLFVPEGGRNVTLWGNDISLKIAQTDFSQLISEKSSRVFEIFLINDETPKKTIYETYNKFLFNGIRDQSFQVPFIPIYYLYLLFAIIVRFFSNLLGYCHFAALLPDPSFLYFYFHHWTFFNSTKSLLLLDYRPEHDFKECVYKSVHHYNKLQKKDIKKFSWQNSIN